MYKSLARLAVLLAGCAACMACASNMPTTLPIIPAGKGMIYVYYPETLGSLLMPAVLPDDAKLRWKIFVDNQVVGSIAMGEYVAIEVPPGLHHVQWENGRAQGVKPPELTVSPAFIDPKDTAKGQKKIDELNATVYRGFPVNAVGGGAYYFDIHHEVAGTVAVQVFAVQSENVGREVVLRLRRRPSVREAE